MCEEEEEDDDDNQLFQAPEELLIEEILSRLLVKSLMQFKSICKTWCALPTSPSFFASHLEKDATSRLVTWNANQNGLLVGHDGFHTFTSNLYCDF